MFKLPDVIPWIVNKKTVQRMTTCYFDKSYNSLTLTLCQTSLSRSPGSDLVAIGRCAWWRNRNRTSLYSTFIVLLGLPIAALNALQQFVERIFLCSMCSTWRGRLPCDSASTLDNDEANTLHRLSYHRSRVKKQFIIFDHESEIHKHWLSRVPHKDEVYIKKWSESCSLL